MRIKVSVIVPVYNVQDYLSECIESIINQTLKEIEIILVNDGSTDNSLEICKYYSKKDNRIYVIDKKNGGQSSARNRGLNIAKGEYILFVDSDDYIINTACEILYTNAIKNELDIIHGTTINSNENISTDNFKVDDIITGTQYIINSMKKLNYDIVPWLNLIKKEYLIKNNIKFIEGYVYEDQEYSLKLFTKNKCRFAKIKFPFYFYRTNREGSTTNSIDVKKGTDLVYIINKMIEYIECKNFDSNDKKYIFKTVSLAFYHLSRLWIRMNENDQNYIINNIDWNLKKKVLKYPYKDKKIIINNILFSFCPKALKKLYELRGNIK